ncbi:U4/U6 snRNA-associated-splicing factor PRP24 [Magnaporthiopsis poae ATCC 64411]|uniref:U4/U6 snRNA-associated-splicing factor PRP24 n=1 Tax=Magnaporthiopsis poae (strain ATCC 64411 / 73-15) TaxID=644358 RepID=A0A0C4DSA7_MAGP6|nr:U4/U6 snRNA-associated-splicing factor PRP24 [Magnaporthiopsis poae ATCC 64411]
MNDRMREANSASAPPTSVPPRSPPSAPPIGEDSWVDYIDQQKQQARDLEARIQILELYKKATTAEPGSLRIWLAYCEYFWSLYQSCQHPSHQVPWTWPAEELQTARDIFSLDSALRVWQEGHDATQHRLGDSHELWNRWIAREMELLSRTKTAEGVKRITHLFRNRLLNPHSTWTETSQAYSTFLSEYNHTAWESSMKDISVRSQSARDLYEKRDPFETKLARAARVGDLDGQRTAMKEYLQFEIASAIREKKNPKLAIEIAMGLFSRALTGILASDETTWTDYAVFVSSLYHRFSSPQTRDPDMLQVIPSSLSVLQGAVSHCPWSGPLWARYILSAEEAGLSFSAMERIKHAATDNSQLDRDGMIGVVEMYAAWCGYLKRSALDPAASEETTDLADSGLLAALEAVQVWGERRFGNAYVGDPDFRLERVLITYLTEKHGAVEEARAQWVRLAEKPLYAASYNFWLHYYSWEIQLFRAETSKRRSPTPGPSLPPRASPRSPTQATAVLQRALKRKDLDWPERIIEIYLQHCNDYETPENLRLAYDFVHRTKKQLEQRRKEEAAANAAAAAAAYSAASAPAVASAHQAEAEAQGSPSAVSKRKRGDTPDRSDEGANKRVKNQASDATSSTVQADEDSSSQAGAAQKRDREHTSVIVTNLPADTTQTRVRQYFREYGHVNNLVLRKVDDGQSAVAVVEFRSPDDARSALLRDGKYFGQQIVGVKPADRLTLFVTNYPPTADESYLRNLFADCGEILDVRLPSLKFNTHRRFCYITFRELEGAAAATKLDGRVLEGRFKLSAKYSNPAQKKAREGATSEGREVKIQNLPSEADDEAVKELFGKYGKIQTVRILRNMAGKSQRTGFVVFEDKSEAETAAAELNMAKMRSSILTVEVTKAVNFKPIARAVKSTSPAPTSASDKDEDVAMTDGAAADRPSGNGSKESRDLRTFAVLGLSDTVSDARVRALVEQHGVVTKFILRPDHAGAIVEMEDQAAVGKAQLALQGSELDGRAIRTGTVAELLSEKAVYRTDRIDRPAATAGKAGLENKAVAEGGEKKKTASLMMPPPRLHRPALGQNKPKRGLGFVKTAAPREMANGQGSSSAATNGVAGVAPKSNAQFRDMFLSSGRDKKDSGDAKQDVASDKGKSTDDQVPVRGGAQNGA